MGQQTIEPEEEVTPAPRRRRSPVFYIGLVLVLAGLSMLAWVAWQFYGTNIVSHQRQEQAVTALQNRWKAEANGTATTGPTPTEEIPVGRASALIRIPRFGADYVMPVFEGVGDDVLAKGFGHFEDSADPGHKGNYALAAHRVTHGEPLRNMPSLRPGDKVIVETREATYTYVLDTDPNDLVVTFHDVWVVDPLPHNPVAGGVEPDQRPGQRLLTLTTCAELFHTDNRMIAFGHLVDTVEKPAR